MTQHATTASTELRGFGHSFDRIRRRPAGAIALLFLAIQIACVVGWFLYPDSFRYLSVPNIEVMLKAVAPMGIMALGVGILMIAGEFDLSVGTVYTFTAIVAATLVGGSGGEAGMSPYLAALIGLGIGVGAGLVNGIIAIRFAIPSFIVTLGAMLLWKGATLLYNGASSVRFRPPEGHSFNALFGGEIEIGSIGVHMSFVWLIVLAIVFYFILHHHKLGNHFYAVGGNRQAAIAIGINPTRTKLIAFAFAGGCAAFSGIIATSRVGSVQPGGGLGLELQAIAACVIGGFALMGGRGSIIGVVLGTALIYTIQDILLLLRAPGFYFDMFVGGLIVIAAISNQMLRARN
ncbi:MAG: ABC transporter permease [Alphaproteobacteria bacterium]